MHAARSVHPIQFNGAPEKYFSKNTEITAKYKREEIIVQRKYPGEHRDVFLLINRYNSTYLAYIELRSH